MMSGCVVLPVPMPEHGLAAGRGEIAEQVVEQFQTGQTMREEVLLTLGEPSVALMGDKIFIYHWQVINAYVIWAVYGGNGDIEALTKDYLVMMEFDQEDKLQRVSRTSTKVFNPSMVSTIDDWTPPESEKISGVNNKLLRSPPPLTINLMASPHSDAREVISITPLRFNLKVIDGRDEKHKFRLGEVVAAFNTKLYDIYSSQAVTETIKKALVTQLLASGHQVVEEEPDINISVELQELVISTPINWPSWDMQSSLQVFVGLAKTDNSGDYIDRTYKSVRVEKSWLGEPDMKGIEESARKCIEDFLKQFATDAEISHFLAEN